ncbi:MAG: hypothetical protein ACI9A2_003006, partial [Halioglobus sp.]
QNVMGICCMIEKCAKISRVRYSNVITKSADLN